jgi:hypothetical protein
MLPSLGGRADCVSAHAVGALIWCLSSQEGRALLGAANFIPATNGKRASSSDLRPVRAWPSVTFPDPADVNRSLQGSLGVV